MTWNKGLVTWELGNTLYVSVVFTWDLPCAQLAVDDYKGKVVVGGGAVKAMPDYLKGANIGGVLPYNPLHLHNPLATFTSRGCSNQCPFCTVPRIEGDIQELKTWEIKPIVCDNNLFACSKTHIWKVIDSLKSLPYVDFNQGLDARLFTLDIASKLSELKRVKLRFAFDHIRNEREVVEAVRLAQRLGMKDLGVYVLIGYDDTPDDAMYRLEVIRGLGVKPNPMRYQPLYTLEKNEYVSPNWTDKMLKKVMRYYSRLNWLEHIPFDEYQDDGQASFWE